MWSEKACLLWLHLVPGLSFQRRHRLQEAVRQGERFDPEVALPELDYGQQSEQVLAWYAAADWLLAYAQLATYPCLIQSDPAYPSLLKQIHQPPQVLFYQGDLSLLQGPCLSVVGSRKCSGYVQQVLRTWMPTWVASELVLVSGNATGVDAWVHQQALAQGGKTIAVLGTGVDQVYPPDAGVRQAAIARQGLVLSEFLPWEKAKRDHFPQRNRIVVGLSTVLLVAEARRRSGSTLSANIAVDENRQVFAIPGSVLDPGSGGSNQLLAEGAGVATHAKSVIID